MSYGSPKWQEWILDEEAALPLLEHAYKVGLNTWDTADVYSNGLSEEIIGKALKKYDIPRAKVVILSKCYFGVDSSGDQPRISAMGTNDGAMVNEVGLSRKVCFAFALINPITYLLSKSIRWVSHINITRMI